ncbi:ANTAR domain-containing protein [Amycolatopsis marina]|uniref:ANTAR domain-containing protein n=1 Tax=Amycolatopsis marina TaxID=490629 RepID=A0A1I0WRG6_9PSEU|nr:ANTAR domain-containing protein [Amycolatopsis marina]SFA91007.1 ANTAR domain-containing protein [Amycolatopsis marina]
MTVTSNPRANQTATRRALGPELLMTLLDYVRSEVEGCVGAGLHTSSGGGGTLAVSGLAEAIDALQWELDEGPVPRAATEQRSATSPNLQTDERWPSLATKITTLDSVPGQLAAVAVAGSWDDEGPVVLSIYLDHEATPGDLRVIERIEPMMAMSAALVEFAADETVRGEQLVAMVEHRRVIEQAKGMIMAVRRCDAENAFGSLVVSSQHFNVKLRDLAVALVELVGQAPAEQTSMEALGRETGLASPGEAARRAAQLTWAALDADAPGDNA